jgi:threonine dehydrogenase-like Zn-dependent dehydrogenase
MRGAVLHASGDVRCEQRPDPVIIEPTDAIMRTVATCVCGSDLWPYRGIDQVTRSRAIGLEFCGIVDQMQPGQFVIGGFLASAPSRCCCVREYADFPRLRRPLMRSGETVSHG